MACGHRSHRAALLMLQECQKRGKVSLAAYGWALVCIINPHCPLITFEKFLSKINYNCVVTPELLFTPNSIVTPFITLQCIHCNVMYDVILNDLAVVVVIVR